MSATRALLIVMLCIVSVLSARQSAMAEAQTACKLEKIASLPITVTPENQVFVDGSIGGQKVRFRVDIGSPMTVMDPAVLKTFGLKTDSRSANAISFGGRFFFDMSEIPDLAIGQYKFGNRQVAVASKHFLEDGSIGVIGEDFLKAFDLDIDLGNQKLDLFALSDCSGEPIYWSKTFNESDLDPDAKQPVLKFVLNGITARAVMDTGTPVTIVRWELANRLGVDKSSPGVAAAGSYTSIDAHALEKYTYRFNEITIGDETIKNPALNISNLFHYSDDISTRLIAPKNDTDIDAVIGVDFLINHHLYMERKRGRVYFTWNGGRIFHPPSNVSGNTAARNK